MKGISELKNFCRIYESTKYGQILFEDVQANDPEDSGVVFTFLNPIDGSQLYIKLKSVDDVDYSNFDELMDKIDLEVAEEFVAGALKFINSNVPTH